MVAPVRATALPVRSLGGPLLVALFLAGAVPPSVAAQEGYEEEMRSLLDDDAIQRAFEYIEASDSRTLQDQIELTEIPAPPFGEEERAREFLSRMQALGVDEGWIDEEGNAIALRRGSVGDEVVAISGHLDTVFPDGTDVTVRTRGDTLFAPGISDDGRGLATVLAVLRALNEAEVETRSDLLFIGTVGEEGIGDLRGVKHLFSEAGSRIDAFISVDGANPRGITHQALGSHRYRVTFLGPGGHSWGAFGLVNPAHALGRAIGHLDDLADRFTQEGPRSSYNVGRIGGGTSVNSIPYESWMEVDLRSEEQWALLALDSLFHEAMERAEWEANQVRRRGDLLTVEVEMIGSRPSGEIAPSDPFIQRAIAATRALGMEPTLGRSSTDSNVPIALGIPSMTIGGGGASGRAHSPDEWFLNRDGPRGIQRALLIMVAQAGLASEGD